MLKFKTNRSQNHPHVIRGLASLVLVASLLFSLLSLTQAQSADSAAAALERAFDINLNGQIDDEEILDALARWTQDRTIPGSQQKLTDEQILDLISKWIRQTQFSLPRPQTFGPPKPLYVSDVESLRKAVLNQPIRYGAESARGSISRSVVVLTGGVYNLDESPLLIQADGLFLQGQNAIVQGEGILIDIAADEVTVQGVTVRNGRVGIMVERARYAVIVNNVIHNNKIGIQIKDRVNDRTEITINNNDISRNRQFGLLSSVNSGNQVNAQGNWWGSASGPNDEDHPQGRGDRIKGNVAFLPFLEAPLFSSAGPLQITAFELPETVAPGSTVTLRVVIENPGAAESTQDITLSITAPSYTDRRTFPVTIIEGTQISLYFQVEFPRPGTFLVTLKTKDDTRQQTVTALP